MRGAAIFVLLAACYSPSPPSGVPCGPGDSCPSGLTCTNGSCGGGDTSDGPIIVDAACGACSADGSQFVPCTGAVIDCPLGCASTGGDHCVRVVPSNELDPSGTSMTDDIVVAADTTVDTDTGEWSGGITRPASGGVAAGIRFTQVTSTQGATIGVFSMTSFTLKAGASLQFTGGRAAAILAEGPIVIDGLLDGSAGCGMDRSCGGPGGGTGSRMGAPASGGCAAGDGINTMLDDGGGGGGGGGEAGTVGGAAMTAAGGTAGAACLDPDLIPLRGGGGGGAGGRGSSAFSKGGGGGGAIELVSQTRIEVSATGLIYVGGDGGDGGQSDAANAGAGGGGGGGGGILLEAPQTIALGALVANGGAGGGGGNSQVGNGAAGNNANKDATVATGGTGVAAPTPGNGGNGGAAAIAPTAGQDATNGGGGGGARGAIRVNAKTKNLGGTISPPATTGTLVTQ